MKKKPNVILILNDDMGYSDIGCYGGEVITPNLDRLAKDGISFTQFYNTARCCPSRASLLTGLHPHQTGIGILTYDDGPEGYAGDLNNSCVTMAEMLKGNGYRTYMSGKWHVSKSITAQSDSWPRQRGFDYFYGTIIGAGSYYDPNTLTRENENIEHEVAANDDFFYTDAISDQAAQYIKDHVSRNPNEPFFQYVAYTAPHWPLHAHEEDIAKYKGRFDAGWDQLREERLNRMIQLGIIDKSWKLTDRDENEPAWEDTENKAWLLRCMEVYAAQIDRMDQGIGRILASLEETGQLEHTIIIFLSDNGACAEDILPDLSEDGLVNELLVAKSYTRNGEKVQFGNNPDHLPGAENTYQSYGRAWANLSNTPFKLYKHWIHEGGIATPFIVHWPQGITDQGAWRHTPAQLTDVMATIADITGATYPTQYNGHDILPLEGTSMLPIFHADRDRVEPLFWEHEGNAGVRVGKWKLVKKYPGHWELFDMDADRTEMNNVADRHPELVIPMSEQYEVWAKRCHVIPRERILQISNEQGAIDPFSVK